MRSWFALIVAPFAALAAQSIMYSLVTPSCASQSTLHLHAVAVAALAFTVTLALLARSDWKHHHQPKPPDDDAGDVRTTRRFLAMAGTAVASLSSLVVLAMWFGTWVLSPCFPWP